MVECSPLVTMASPPRKGKERRRHIFHKGSERTREGVIRIIEESEDEVVLSPELTALQVSEARA